MQNNQVCPICKNKFNNIHLPLQLECSHVFCSICLAGLKNKGREAYSCQICRAKIRVEIGQLQPQLQLIQGENANCSTHKKPFDLFCVSHNQKICSYCLMLNHKNCNKILTIEDFNNQQELQKQQKQQKVKDLESNHQSLSNQLQILENHQSQIQKEFINNRIIFQQVSQLLINSILNQLKQMFQIQKERYIKANNFFSANKKHMQGIFSQMEQLKQANNIQMEEFDQKVQVVQKQIKDCCNIESSISQLHLQQVQKKEILQSIMENLIQNELIFDKNLFQDKQKASQSKKQIIRQSNKSQKIQQEKEQKIIQPKTNFPIKADKPESILPKNKPQIKQSAAKDITQKNYMNFDFTNQDFQNLDLTNSDLSDTTFTSCNLANSNLTQANLRNTKFINCNLSNANLTSIITEHPHIFTGHTSLVYAVAISSDSEFIVSGSYDCTIILWDVKKGTSKTMVGHTSSVNAVAISSDSKFIVSGSNDNTLRLWDVKTVNSQTMSGHTLPVTSISISRDSEFIVSGSYDCTIILWYVKTGTSKTMSGHTGSVNAVAISSDSKFIVSGSGDQTVRLWDVKTGTCKTMSGHTGYVWSVSISSDSEFIVSGS